LAVQVHQLSRVVHVLALRIAICQWTAVDLLAQRQAFEQGRLAFGKAAQQLQALAIGKQAGRDTVLVGCRAAQAQRLTERDDGIL